MSSNLVVNTHGQNTKAGTFMSQSDSATYSAPQAVNQTLVIKNGTQYLGGTGFSQFMLATDTPVLLTASKGGNPNYINMVVNQAITIDDSVDSFAIVNNGLAVAHVQLMYIPIGSAGPATNTIVTSVNEKTGVVKILGGIGTSIDNSSDSVVVNAVPPSGTTIGAVKAGTGVQIASDGTLSITNAGLVKTVSGQSPDFNGNVIIQAQAAYPGGVTLISEQYEPDKDPSGATTGTILIKTVYAGRGIDIDTSSQTSITLNNTGVLTVNSRGPDSNGNIPITAYDISGLARVATTGRYTDLTNIPPLVKTINGNGPDVNGNVALTIALPALTFAFGTGGQPNNGFGIDQTTYWQADSNGAGWTVYNGLQMTPHPDGTFELPAGTYLVCFNVKVQPENGGTDTYQLPAQMTFAVTNLTAYGWPGVYQNAVQVLPEYPISTVATDGRVLGNISGSAVLPFYAGTPGILGYTKLVGSVNGVLVKPQGYCTFIKLD